MSGAPLDKFMSDTSSVRSTRKENYSDFNPPADVGARLVRGCSVRGKPRGLEAVPPIRQMRAQGLGDKWVSSGNSKPSAEFRRNVTGKCTKAQRSRPRRAGSLGISFLSSRSIGRGRERSHHGIEEVQSPSSPVKNPSIRPPSSRPPEGDARRSTMCLPCSRRPGGKEEERESNAKLNKSLEQGLNLSRS